MKQVMAQVSNVAAQLRPAASLELALQQLPFEAHLMRQRSQLQVL